jgi:hypothetical protein
LLSPKPKTISPYSRMRVARRVIAVAAHQAEAVEAPGVEQVHGVEDGREGVEADVVGVDEYGEGLEFVLHPVMTQFFLCGRVWPGWCHRRRWVES